MLQFCWTTTSLCCWISHIHTLWSALERARIWQDPRSKRGVLEDCCQLLRSALRLQQLSSNHCRVFSQENKAQFLLAKIQLPLTCKHHPEQFIFTAGWSAMDAVCPTAIGRETPVTRLPFMCCFHRYETCLWSCEQSSSAQGGRKLQ